MPSVLDQKFKYNLGFKSEKRKEIEKYLLENIGPRTYVLNSQIGGKQWVLRTNRMSNDIEIGVNDEMHATFISLKFN